MYREGCPCYCDICEELLKITGTRILKYGVAGLIGYAHVRIKCPKEKGGKWQSATKGDLYERTTVYSGRIGKDGLRKENKPVKTEKLVKRGRL